MNVQVQYSGIDNLDGLENSWMEQLVSMRYFFNYATLIYLSALWTAIICLLT